MKQADDQLPFLSLCCLAEVLCKCLLSLTAEQDSTVYLIWFNNKIGWFYSWIVLILPLICGLSLISQVVCHHRC